MTTTSEQSCPRADHLKKLLVTDVAYRQNHPEELVYFSQSGGIYRMTMDESGKPGWGILTNQNGACGWYRTDSPYVNDWVLKPGAVENPPPHPGKAFEELGDSAWKKAVHMRDGRDFELFPSDGCFHTYDMSNLSFTTHWKETDHPGQAPEQDRAFCGHETITIFIHDNDQVLGKCCPLSWRFVPRDDGPVWENLYHGDVGDEANDELILFDSSCELRDLPIYNPTSYDFIKPGSFLNERSQSGNEQEDSDSSVQDKRLDLGVVKARTPKPEEDKRLFYTKNEFNTYYGPELGDRMWEMASPRKMSRVLMLEYILNKNASSLDTHNRNYIIDKMISEFL